MRRLSSSLLIAVLLSVVGVGWLMDRIFSRLDHSSMDTLNVALSMGETLVHIVNQGDPAQTAELAAATDTDYSVSLINVDDIGLPDTLYTALKVGEPLVLESELNLSLYFKLASPNQVLLIRLPPEHSGSTFIRLLLTLVFYTLVAVLLMVWLYPLVRKLKRLEAVAKHFGEGDLQQRIITSPESSLHDIETEFNRMAQRIQGLVDDNKMLCGAVSHDLRTPLARLRFGIDAMEEQLQTLCTTQDGKTATSQSVLNDYLGRINTDLTAMEQLVDVLLEFARLDQQLSELPLSPVNLLSVVRDCVDSQDFNATRKFQLDLPQNDVMILADERYASMLVGNLVQNAAKFSQNNIRISVINRGETQGHDVDRSESMSGKAGVDQASSAGIVLMVEDDGPGIAVSEIERVTKPFEKGSAATKDTVAKSYGLGLAIVARIAQWFGAEIELGASKTLGGARVSITFNRL